MKKVTPSVEEYLEAIYKLQERTVTARTKELAERMGVSLGTVTGTVEMLERQGLVTHMPYRGVKLTGEGRKTALGVIRRHRLAECLLTDILHVDWTEAHEPACRLEHGLSEEVMRPIRAILGNPRTCPHGNPIPTKGGNIAEEELQPLADLKPREFGTIVRIVEEDRDLLRHLRSLGLVPGAAIRIERKIPFDGSLTVRLRDGERSLSSDIASVIWVRR
jgi:DtxR family Mn-dependent transcriptional regulator